MARGSISRVNKPELSQESATYQQGGDIAGADYFKAISLTGGIRRGSSGLPGELKLQRS
ncbi:hypothetical protein M1N18_00130 [Dehalococcoidales bacterium]|nr:hypothetical protein [Dehalococcoidales bacterium]